MKKDILSLCIVTLLIILAVPAFGSLPTIYVSIPPQQWLIKAIAGKLATTEILLGKGQDPHTFEPTPRQIAGLSKAELYFTIGMPFENHLSMKLEQTNSNLKIVDTSQGTHKISDEEHSSAAHSDAHDSSHNDLDPHIWLSPVNLITIAANMTESMVETDPANREAYEKNYTILKQRLLELHEKIKIRLAPYEGAQFFVFHPAFSYFADEYHLRQVPVEIEGRSPSPKQLFKIVSQARSQNIHVLFIQPQFDPNSAKVVAQAIDGTVVALDPLAEDIIVNLETMANAIAESLKNRNN